MDIRKEFVTMPLPGWSQISRFLGWGTGRVVFSSSYLCIHVTRATAKAIVWCCDATERSLNKLVQVYDALPYGGVMAPQIIESAAQIITEPMEIITDIIGAIEGKRVMIIGEMGTGKSTLAQYLAYTVGGRVKVYECEGTPTDWTGLEVIGRGEDWEAITHGMDEDLEDLSNQMKLRNERGDGALVGTEQVYIVEEYPELVSKVPSSGEWLDRHARRGRKAKRFAICLSQYDKVGAWGLEGKSDLADAFYKIRLGKKAIFHAKSLRNDDLINWLRQDKSHCLIDDQPCKLPSYREMKSVSGRGGQTIQQPSPNNSNHTQKAPEQSPQPASDEDFEAFSQDNNRILWRLIQQFGAEKTDSAIVTEILGFTGKRYGQGKALLDTLRQEFE